MSIIRRILDKVGHADSQRKSTRTVLRNEGRMITNGWDRYAREWRLEASRFKHGVQVKYLGDEWTAEAAQYGLGPDVVADFSGFINHSLLDPHLPPGAAEALEIGPGGRLTALLLPRTKLLHLVESSEAMLQQLKKRFAGVSNAKYYHTDGLTLPALKPCSLDYVIAFDVFVHFEPRLIFWYLRQIVSLLKVGGTGIIHYANAMTPISG